MWWRSKRVESTRYYYSDDKIFEKSLDVYKPIEASNNSKDLPVVVLVVGSGWIGHRALIYVQTSWWNSSGPKTVASLGTTCVCIRHRGAFCVLPSTSHLSAFLALFLALAWNAAGGEWALALAATAMMAFVIVLLALGGKGSARFEDMLDDVAEALKWIDNNHHLLKINQDSAERSLPPSKSASFASIAEMTETSISRSGSDTTSGESLPWSSSFSDSEIGSGMEPPSPLLPHHPTHHRHHNPQHRHNNQNRRNIPLVFGGYSSGGHVAATLLQRPELFKKHNLPKPENLFQGILMISAVFAVRFEQIEISDKDKTIVIATPQDAPQWLVNFVIQLVWGPDECQKLSSPLVAAIKENKPPPRLRHLLVGCRNEVFGLNWLDIFFCSKAYRDMIHATTGHPAKYVQVESDHWNILNSTGLRAALQEELPVLISK